MRRPGNRPGDTPADNQKRNQRDQKNLHQYPQKAVPPHLCGLRIDVAGIMNDGKRPYQFLVLMQRQHKNVPGSTGLVDKLTLFLVLLDCLEHSKGLHLQPLRQSRRLGDGFQLCIKDRDSRQMLAVAEPFHNTLQFFE